MNLALSDQEAELLDDILGMWIEGAEAEVPSLAVSKEEAHWSTFQMRRTRDVAARVKMRIQLERSSQ